MFGSSDAPPVNFCKPAVDVLFRSAAETSETARLASFSRAWGTTVLPDRAPSVEAGGSVVAQDERTSTVWGMPGTVARDGLCTAVLAPEPLALTVAAPLAAVSGGAPRMTLAPASLQTALTRLTGFAIDPRRADAIADRVAPVIAAHGVRDGLDLMARLRPGADAPLAAALVDAMVIKETLFFRDPRRGTRCATRSCRVSSRRGATQTTAPLERRLLHGRSPTRSPCCSTRKRVRSRAGPSTSSRPISRSPRSRPRAPDLLAFRSAARSVDQPPATAFPQGADGLGDQRRASRGSHVFRAQSDGRIPQPSGRSNRLLPQRDALHGCRASPGHFARLAQVIAPDGYLVLGAAETIIGVTEAFAPYAGSPSIFVLRHAPSAKQRNASPQTKTAVALGDGRLLSGLVEARDARGRKKARWRRCDPS